MSDFPHHDSDVETLRIRCPHFRILVMGRSNAGKTTILKKVCNTVDEPMIFSPSGKQIDTFVITPSAERGHHDINNEMIFKSNPEFIFHDSRGFEAGSVDETETVRGFLSKRAKARELADQLHAVWYCLPTDTARPILAADEIFFNEFGIGKAPVIVIFTKFDGLVTTSFNELRGHLSIKEARKQAPAAAEIKLHNLFKMPLDATKFPPTASLHLGYMERPGTTCSALIEETANAITDDALKTLFISVQQINVDLCIQQALRKANLRNGDLERVMSQALRLFPHVWRNEEYAKPVTPAASSFIRRFSLFLANTSQIGRKMQAKDAAFLDSGLKNERYLLNALTALLLCMEQTFTQSSVWGEDLPKAFSAALDVYVASGHIIKIHDAITTILSETQLPLQAVPRTTKLLDKEATEKILALIVENRLRL